MHQRVQMGFHFIQTDGKRQISFTFYDNNTRFQLILLLQTKNLLHQTKYHHRYEAQSIGRIKTGVPFTLLDFRMGHWSPFHKRPLRELCQYDNHINRQMRHHHLELTNAQSYQWHRLRDRRIFFTNGYIKSLSEHIAKLFVKGLIHGIKGIEPDVAKGKIRHVGERLKRHRAPCTGSKYFIEPRFRRHADLLPFEPNATVFNGLGQKTRQLLMGRHYNFKPHFNRFYDIEEISGYQALTRRHDANQIQ